MAGYKFLTDGYTVGALHVLMGRIVCIWEVLAFPDLLGHTFLEQSWQIFCAEASAAHALHTKGAGLYHYANRAVVQFHSQLSP